ncbi:MFS transporter [Sphingobium sp. SJ10-10]|uniref:MFS transporter n=1 Tax=Sphingobium sp. SJ10-10 TaxID=3114999 RepID=UPI002E197E7A|nr:MFS transporter [Sphingobium sp. SJ10-10]
MTQISSDLSISSADGSGANAAHGPFAKEEWRHSWAIVAVAILGCATSSSGFLSLATLLPPILAETGWTRVQAMSAALIYSSSALLLAPSLGRLVDRYGVRRVALPGVFVFALGQVAVGLSGKTIGSWWFTWTLASVGIQFIGPAVWAAAIALRFVANRGLALGMTMAGAGLAPLIVPIVSTMISEAFHWRYFYFLLAAFSVLALLPALYLALPKQEQVEKQQAAAPSSAATGVTLRQALASRLYWRLLLAIGVVSGAIAFLLLTMPDILKDEGYDAFAAATIATMYGPAQIIGRVGGGLLLDRIRGNLLGAIIFFLPALACFMLLQDDVGSFIFLVPALVGLAAGVEIDVMAYLVSRYFGLRHYGAIYGVLYGTFSVSLGVAPMAGAMLRQAYGSYDMALGIAMGALLVSSAIMCSLGRYRY